MPTVNHVVNAVIYHVRHVEAVISVFLYGASKLYFCCLWVLFGVRCDFSRLW